MTKIATDVEEQIARLESRGMTISDKEFGSLENTSYLCTQKVHLIVSTFILHYKRN